MNISKELLEKAKQAKTAEELLAMAKAENLELTEEEAVKAVAELKRSGELADEELDNVTGGCGYQSGDNPIFNVGDKVKYKRYTGSVHVGGGSIPRCEETISTVVTSRKENGIFKYKLANGDCVPENELEKI